MFIAFALLILAAVALITLRDWAVLKNLTPISRQKKLQAISHALSLQDWEKAEKELAPILAKGKRGKEECLYEIQLLRGMGKFTQALKKAEECQQLYSEELQFKLEEGLILLELRRAQEALAAFEICAPIMRSESDQLALGTALLQAGMPKDCYDLISPLLPSTQNGQVALLGADALYELKQFPEAIATYILAIELGCKNYHLFTQLGHAYRRLGNLSEAEKIFKGLLEKNPHDIESILGIGACLQERGHHAKALILFQSALKESGPDLRLTYQAAGAALRAKKYRLAEEYFADLIQREAADPHILSCYGFTLENQKKWQEAEQTYLKLIQLFPLYPQGYRALAWMFGVGLSQTVSQEAGMHYAYKALKLKNDNLSWEILSACAARVGDFNKAYQIQLSLAKQDDDSPSRLRRQQALRALRKKTPLGDTLVLRSQVA